MSGQCALTNLTYKAISEKQTIQSFSAKLSKNDNYRFLPATNQFLCSCRFQKMKLFFFRRFWNSLFHKPEELFRGPLKSVILVPIERLIC